MLEHAIYSVISPEGCAAILWRDAAQAREAARAMRLTARDLDELGVIDEIIPEPEGGAHADPHGAARLVGEVLAQQLHNVLSISPEDRLAERDRKFRSMGRFTEVMG